MDKKKYQIFISSTYTDLVESRKKIQETILSMYQFPIGMEMFSAGDDEQWEVIQETIDSSDYYVLVIGHRYGSETSEGISYTEKEYDYAKEKGIPILVFIRNRNIPLMPEERDDESEKIFKLNNFIKKATSNKMCDFWNTKDDLALKVSVALNKQFNKRQRPGWIRADNVDFTEISNELMKLSQENRSLREENENLKSKLVIKKPVVNLYINNGEEFSVDYPQKYNNIRHQFRVLSYEDVPQQLKEYVTEEEIINYNKSLPSKNDIDRYVEEKIEYLRIKNSGKDINVKVSNDGSIKANNIYIDIEFPKEIRVMEIDKIENLKEPEELEMPVNPIKRAEKEYSKRYVPSATLRMSSLLNYNNLWEENFKPLKLPSVYNNRNSWLENNTITIKINSLIHTRQISLDEKYRIIPL
ncbi:conserved hypothetical protein [Clostridium botulinum C str. Eklund]|nr:conserved hypothetical protein [Clostridium botulinum C str. Eklund]NEZ49323.1 DUF4062 domain-containing protein [Clostridium botulinum]